MPRDTRCVETVLAQSAALPVLSAEFRASVLLAAAAATRGRSRLRRALWGLLVATMGLVVIAWGSHWPIVRVSTAYEAMAESDAYLPRAVRGALLASAHDDWQLVEIELLARRQLTRRFQSAY
jgi:hypothetical protein